MKTRLLLILTLLLSTLSARAQDTAAIDAIFSRHNQTDSPGCAVGVSANGETVFSKGYGMANLELAVPNSPQHVYYAASTSKQFAAAAIAIAYLEGKLSLTDSIRKHFPELPPYADSIEVQHLVHHTSGLRDYLALMPLGGYPIENSYSNEWILALIARQKNTNFVPGEQYSYSNSGYFLMGELIKRVTGKSLRDYTNEKILRPLGMTHSHFHDNNREIVAGRASAYRPKPAGGFELSWYTNFDKVGSGGLLTSIEDLMLWERNFLNDRLAEGQLVTTMLKRGKLNNGEPLDYAFGLFHGSYRGAATVSHGGAFMGFRAQFYRFVEHKLGIAVLCNRADAQTTQLVEQTADVFLGDVLAAKTEQTDATTNTPRRLRQRYAGHYQNSATGGKIDLVEQDKTLTISLFGVAFPLQMESDTRFRIANAPINLWLEFEDDNDLRLLTASGGEFSRLSRRSLANTTDVTAYVGEFYSEELDAQVKVSQVEGALQVQAGAFGAEPMTLSPTFENTLQSADGQIVLVYEPSESGGYDRFVVNNSRATGIEAVRVTP